MIKSAQHPKPPIPATLPVATGSRGKAVPDEAEQVAKKMLDARHSGSETDKQASSPMGHQ